MSEETQHLNSGRLTPAFDPDLVSQIGKCGIIAVLVIEKVEDAIPTAEALLAGGVNVMELTLRTPSSVSALKVIRSKVPEMIAGAGTILCPDQVQQVLDSGGVFGVAPGVNPIVLSAARSANLPFAPGISSPSDIEISLMHGCKLLKFFPAETSGGVAHLKAMAAPYAHLELDFIPLGGLNAENIISYLREPYVCALGGSWLAHQDLIRSRQWTKITTLARKAVNIIESTKKK